MSLGRPFSNAWSKFARVIRGDRLSILQRYIYLGILSYHLPMISSKLLLDLFDSEVLLFLGTAGAVAMTLL